MATMARKTWIAGIAVLAAFFFALLLIAAQPAYADHDRSKVKIQLEPKNDTNTVGEQHCVTAEVKDPGHKDQAVAGETITFSVTGANEASGTSVTNSDGKATFCYIGTKAGTDNITAFLDLNKNGQLDKGEPSASATKTYRAGPAAKVELAPLTAINTTGQPHCVTATVTDSFGNPISGASVFFSVTGANPRPAEAKTTDSTGKATFCYTGTNAGKDVITAFVDRDADKTFDAGEPTGTATKTYVAPAPAMTTVSLSPVADTNPAGQEHCVTATVTTATGTVGAGVSVVFSVTGANTAGGTVTTDATGKATFCYTGENVGQDVITAYADADKSGSQNVLTEPTATALKTYIPGAPKNVTLFPTASENTVGTQHCVTATVTDAFGNRVGAGTKVFFTVTGANSAAGSQTTGDNGTAVFCYTGTKAGLDTIRAFVDENGNETYDLGEPTGVATKLYHPGVPRTVTLEPKEATNTVGEEHCVTATAHDEFGNRVGAGHPIVFEVTGANKAGPVTVMTDAKGQARFCYTGEKAGKDVITAFIDRDRDGQQDVGTLPGTATKTYLPGPPAKVELNPETATNRAGEEHCVTATVKDRFGNPVSAGHLIVFSVTGENPTAAPVVVVTNADGKATFCYTGKKAGTDTITAFADNNKNTMQDEGEPADTATKTYRPGPPASVELDPLEAENVAGEEHCVTATVKDRFGNLVEAGTDVFFSVTGVNPREPVAVETDANGQAIFCYTGEKAGLDTIKAVADADEDGLNDDVAPVGIATKRYVPGPPATLELSPKTATNTVGQEHCVTAHVEDRFDNPTPGITVEFSVTGIIATEGTSVKTSESGSATTDNNGDAEFCYTSELPGENMITAFADTDNSGTQDAGEPSDFATKTYVLPPSSVNCEITIHDGGWIVAANGDKGTFGGNAKVDASGQIVKGSQEYTDHGPAALVHVKSTEILAVVCEGNSATIYGVANVTAQLPLASGTFLFRVRVTDMGEPGSQPGPDKYGIVVGNAYYTGEQPLQGGNIQIH